MRPAHTSAAGGFTLMELLIVTMLVATMATLGLGGLKTGMRVWERDSNLAEADVEGLALRRFLTDLLSAAKPVAWGNTRPPEIVFLGEPDHLTFATVIPSESLRHATSLVSLHLDDGALVLEWQPLGNRRPVLSDMAEKEVLFDGADGLRFGYDGATEAIRPTSLPRAITLDLDIGGARPAWPTLVAAPLAGRSF